MDVYKHIEEFQKKIFNDSSVVQCGSSNYIYPYTSFHKEVSSNSLNRHYKEYIKNNLVNIYENDDRVLEMIEKMHNKKALERLKKEKERQREKLLIDIFNEDESKNGLGRNNHINISNFEEKLKNKMYNPEHGDNILYILMKFLLNRSKKDKKIKNNKRLDELYSAREKNYSKILDSLRNKKINNSKTSKSKIIEQEINIQKPRLPLFKNNTFRKEKNIENNKSELRKSKSLLNLKSFSKNYLSERNNITNNIKGKTDFLKKDLLNKNDELEIPPINDNNSPKNIFNKEKLNNLSRENIDEKNEFLLFKKKLENNKINSADKDYSTLNSPKSQRSIFEKKRNYIDENNLENILLKFENKSNDLINSRDKSNISGISLRKNKRSLLLNFKKIKHRAEESNQISQSFRSEKKINSKEDAKFKNNNSIFLTKRSCLEKSISTKLTKEEKENMEKYDPRHIIYSIKSNYSLSQTNRHFFGAKKGIDEIDLFKQNFSSEIRKQFIQKDKNLVKMNMKKIIKKFSPHYKFFD